MWIRSQHGKFRYEAQRYKARESGEEKTDLELSGQFTEDYMSRGLKELVGYYSNRLSYEEVSKLLQRLSGQAYLSDQKAEQMVVEQGRRMSETMVDKLGGLEAEGQPLPAIQPEVDLYDSHSEEILLLADGIQVKEQAAQRQKRNDPSGSTAQAKPSASFASSHLVMLAKETGEYEYMSELLPTATQPDGCLAQQVRQQLIAQ